MTYLDLFTSATATFSGFQREFLDADYVIIGVPFDVTSTYRPGSRFAPLAIREASLNIETYSFRAGIDLEELKLHDAGDLHVTGDVHETLKRLKLVTNEILCSGKTPAFIGGEHTLTLGAVQGISKDLAILCFDAHLDLRNEYMGQSVCHATVMRRINEVVKPSRIVEVGTRAVCKEEIEHAEDQRIAYVTAHRIMQAGVEETAKEISALLSGYDRVYLTVDMDVLDPAFAPAVQNPEPEGLPTHMLLDLMYKTCDSRIVGFDVVEVTPHYDMGTTAIEAAKIIFETLSYIHKNQKACANTD
jgi:agmatinase